MKSRRGRAILGVTIAVVVVAAATVAYIVRDLLFAGQISVQSIQPAFVTPIGSDGSLTNVDVGFPWTEQGYCLGQFRAEAKETFGQIRVGAVMSRTNSNENCAGVGSNGKWATAPLSLRAPIGVRQVVRDSNGAPLPVFALTAMLHCGDAISSGPAPLADDVPISNAVVLPKVALQANRTGEFDPSAKWFAKVGLFVRSGASFMLSVPDDWMGRLSIGWGSPATRTMNLHVSGCTSDIRWLVFAGGFWVDEPSCVPIVVNSGSQQETVQIGVGAACPGQAPPPPGI